MNKPSKGLKAVCIIAIVLGSLGVLWGAVGLASLAAGRALQEKLSQQQAFGAPAAQMEVQRQMQQELQDVASRWQWITGPLLALDLAISICLIVGAARSLRLRPGGRTLLLSACWMAIALELAQLVPGIIIHQENMAVTEKFMSRLMETSAPKGQQTPPGFEEGMTLAVKIGAVVGIVFSVLFALVQVGFYLFGAVYLRRPNVRALFGEPAGAELAGSG